MISGPESQWLEYLRTNLDVDTIQSLPEKNHVDYCQFDFCTIDQNFDYEYDNSQHALKHHADKAEALNQITGSALRFDQRYHVFNNHPDILY